MPPLKPPPVAVRSVTLAVSLAEPPAPDTDKVYVPLLETDSPVELLRDVEIEIPSGSVRFALDALLLDQVNEELTPGHTLEGLAVRVAVGVAGRGCSAQY